MTLHLTFEEHYFSSAWNDNLRDGGSRKASMVLIEGGPLSEGHYGVAVEAAGPDCTMAMPFIRGAGQLGVGTVLPVPVNDSVVRIHAGHSPITPGVQFG